MMRTLSILTIALGLAVTAAPVEERLHNIADAITSYAARDQMLALRAENPRAVTETVFRLLDTDPAFARGTIKRERMVMLLARTPVVHARQYDEVIDAIVWAAPDFGLYYEGFAQIVRTNAATDPENVQRVLDAMFSADRIVAIALSLELVARLDNRYRLDAAALRAMILDPHAARPTLAARTVEREWERFSAVMVEIAADPHLAPMERRGMEETAWEQIEALRGTAVMALLKGESVLEHIRWLEEQVQRDPVLFPLLGGILPNTEPGGAFATVDEETRRAWVHALERFLLRKESLRSTELGVIGAASMGTISRLYPDVADQAKAILTAITARHEDADVRMYALSRLSLLSATDVQP